MAAPASNYSWISTFLEAQAAELGAATNTQLAYGRDLKDFAEWLERRGHDFAGADRDRIEGYLVDCDAQGLAKSTRARRLSAIKQLYRFAFDEGWRDDNPAIQIKGPGRDQRLPKTLDVPEVDRLLEAARVTGRTETDRARNTCLAADAVSLLAAVVLYIFAAGVVKGFAFALGLTTIIDLVVFFWFTHPMVSWLAKYRFFNKGHRLSGLSPETLGVARTATGGNA